MSENINLVELVKQAVGEYEVSPTIGSLKSLLEHSRLGNEMDDILTDTATIAVEVIERNTPLYQFRIPLSEDEGIATVKQNEEGKFYIWVISDRFSEGGYQVYSLFDSFTETVLFIINKLVPEVEENNRHNPFEGMTREQISEHQQKGHLKIFKNSSYGHFKIS